jgi:hypothetical protein
VVVVVVWPGNNSAAILTPPAPLCLPGADASIVRRTQSALSAAGEPAVHFGVRFVVGGLTSLLRFVAYGGLVTGLARWAWGRALLLRWPGLFR